MKLPKITKFLIFAAVTLFIFYLIFQKIDYIILKETFLNINLFYLVTAFLILLLAIIVSAKKWQSVLNIIGYHLSFKESFKIIMASFPLSTVTPSKSGDLIRAYYLKDSLSPTRTIGAVMAERLTDVLVLAIYSFIGALVLKNKLILGISLTVILLIPIFLFVIGKIKLPFPKLAEKIENILYASKILIKSPSKSLPVLFYSLLLWLIPFFGIKFLFLSLGANVPLFYIAAAFPITVFAGLIPITIAGMGTRDSAIIYFFSLWAESSICLGVGLLYSLIGYWFVSLIGLLFMKKMLR